MPDITISHRFAAAVKILARTILKGEHIAGIPTISEKAAEVIRGQQAMLVTLGWSKKDQSTRQAAKLARCFHTIAICSLSTASIRCTSRAMARACSVRIAVKSPGALAPLTVIGALIVIAPPPPNGITASGPRSAIRPICGGIAMPPC